MEALYQIDTKYGCCGLTAKDGTVTEAAPMIRWTVGQSLDAVFAWCQYHGYTLLRIN
jgi:hypothetical protein